jgi:hypothetical protein
MTDEDREFHELWEARLLASRGKTQRTQDRVHRRFILASQAREAAQRQARAERAVVEERADKAAYMREYRARKRAWRESLESAAKKRL